MEILIAAVLALIGILLAMLLYKVSTCAKKLEELESKIDKASQLKPFEKPSEDPTRPPIV